MTDDAAPRRRNPWPLLMISILFVLLSIFLFIVLNSKDGRPAIVKTPPAVPAPPPIPVPAETELPAVDPNAEAFAALLRDARKAVDEKRWTDAIAGVSRARALRDEPALKEIEDAVAKGRAAETAEARRRQDRAFEALQEKVEKDQRENLWDACWTALEKFEKEFPLVSRDEEFAGLVRKIRERRDEAGLHYEKRMVEARKRFDEARYPEAVRMAESALLLYPERSGVVKKFQEQASARMLREKMVRVDPAGRPCAVGNDDPAYPDEHPLKQVTLKPFHIDKHEVTNGEYDAFVIATEHPAPLHWPGKRVPAGREKHPVTHVSFDDAAKYAAWALKRLPTAEEWEAAARGPSGPRLYPWGDVFAVKENVFVCNSVEYWQANRTQAPGTTPVDAFDGANSGSPFGVYGMGGNVWEWTSTAVRRKSGETEAEFRVLKGGSFMTPARAIRCSNILLENPALIHFDVGFRCVRDVE